MVCGLGDHAQPCSITNTRTSSWLPHSAADIFANHGGVAAEIKFDFGPRIYHHIYINAVVAHRRPSSPAASTPPSRAASFASPQVFSFSQVPSCTPHSDRITSTVSQGSVPRAHTTRQTYSTLKSAQIKHEEKSTKRQSHRHERCHFKQNMEAVFHSIKT